jgi:hypothetical protein
VGQPITWGGLSPVSADSAIVSDFVAIPAGCIGFSAILNVYGLAPSGISGNLQLLVSNTGRPGSGVVLPGSVLSVLLSSGDSNGYVWSVIDQFYGYVAVGWNQAGMPDSGTLGNGTWNFNVVTSSAGLPSGAPTPSAPSSPSAGSIPASTGALYAMLLDCFPPSWIPTNSILAGDVNYALFTALGVGLGAAGDVVLPINGAVTSALEQQLRIATAFDGMLDQISQDFYGLGLPRLQGETDAHYRARIIAGLFIPRLTRAHIFNFVEDLTGIAPRMVEPLKPSDTGAWTSATTTTVVGGITYYQFGAGLPACYWGQDVASSSPGGMDVAAAPFRWSGRPYEGFIDSAPPETFTFQGDPIVGPWDSASTPSGGVYTVATSGGGGYLSTGAVSSPGPRRTYTVTGGSSNWAYANPNGWEWTVLENGLLTQLNSIAASAVFQQVDTLRPGGILIGGRTIAAEVLSAQGWTS